MRLPLAYHPCVGGYSGAEQREVEPFYPGDPIRQVMKAGIWSFVDSCKELLSGSVLDFGSGRPGTCYQPEPYRRLVYGKYASFDIGDPPDLLIQGNYDAVLCTEVLMYLIDPQSSLEMLLGLLRPGGSLILTYTGAWPENEKSSFWRFTQMGMDLMLKTSGFAAIQHQEIARITISGFYLTLSHGAIAKRPLS